MEISTVTIIIAVVVPVIGLATAAVGCCCCLYCCCCKNHSSSSNTQAAGRTTTTNHTRRSGWGSPGINLESGLFEPTWHLRPTVETDGPDSYKERQVTHLPRNFRNFIVQKIIPYFIDQRLTAYQFAVVVLLSEDDFDNICWTRFSPSNFWGKPILDKTVSLMPQDPTKYRNYVVARPDGNNCHSEEEIFGQYSVTDSPFSHLWSAYVKHSGAYPKCILIYSWNLPCSRCTNVIIRSLREEPYNRVTVIVAHTIFWNRSETESQHKMNTEKLKCENITVKQIPYPDYLSPA